jgi:hypothetical protein
VTGDPRGYYEALGLSPAASLQEIGSAYRRLAKECHPDRPTCADGGQRFRTITEAYNCLSDRTRKASYDRQSEAQQTKETPPPPAVEPVCCEVCGQVTAQPRRLAFWRITSFLLGTHKQPVQRVFCQPCATKEQWRSTIWTSLLGWWGVPWGPIWAVARGLTNAGGGERTVATDEALMCQNAIAFTRRGDAPLAVGLSNILRKSDDPRIGQTAASIIRFFGERGFDTTSTLEDVWKRSILSRAALFLTAFVMPILALGLVMMTWTKSSAIGVDSTVSDSLSPVFGPDTPVTTAAAQTSSNSPIPASEPTCDSRPSNGEVLVDHRGAGNSGHKLEIDNSSAGDAIIKVRQSSGHTLASFFVASGQSATLAKIPDGSYTVQYASGSKLAKDCRRFVNDGTASASAFPGPEDLSTRYEEDVDGTTVVHQKLTYTLYAVPGGNVRPSSIDMDKFNEP